VTGFGKTGHVRTRIEIHFIACYNSHTQALSRHSGTTAIDKEVYFYRQLFADPIKPCRTITDPVGPLGGFNKMACGPKLFHSTSALLVVWWGLLWSSVLSGPLCTQLGRLCLRASLIHPPSLSTHPPNPLFVTSVMFQALLKTSPKISQSIQQLCKLV